MKNALTQSGTDRTHTAVCSVADYLHPLPGSETPHDGKTPPK